ncbi:Lipocalin/cytosolic fatty-acid binding domain, partial [Trinorchestia longiramus]
VVRVSVVVLVCFSYIRPVITLGPSFVRFGFCSDVVQQPDFDMEQFTGLWYGILRVPNEYSPLKRCITSHYSAADENGKFTNSRNGVAENGTEVHSELELMVVDDEFYAYSIPPRKSRPEIGVTVAETDYTNFACVYSCIQRFTFKAEFVAVMSRTPSIKKAYVEQCRATITEQSSFDWSHLSMVEQGE